MGADSGGWTGGVLTSSVPDLKLHPLSIQLDGPDLEIDSDCRNEAWCEAVFTKTQQTTRLSDARIAD